MNAIKTWSPSSLRQLNQAFSGQKSELFKSTRTLPADEKADVLILSAPPLFKSEPLPLAEMVAQAGVEVEEAFEDLAVATRVSPEQKQALEEQGWVLYDNSPRQLQPSLMGSAKPLSRLPDIDSNAMVKADVNLSKGITGKEQIIAVLDSGFDVPHMNERVTYLNVINGSREHHDGSGHGSHTASHIHRAAPEANLIALQVMNDDGTGRPSDILKGLKIVSDLKKKGVDIDLVNMSLGGEPDGLPDTLDPINRMVDRLSQQGITVVAAAGNSGPEGRTIGSPADAPSAITVGAALDPNTVSDFSSRGPTDDGLIRPHLVAPGEFMPGWAVPYSEMYQTAKTVDALRRMPGAQLKELLNERPELGEALGLPPQAAQWPDAQLEKEVRSNLPPMGLNAKGEVLAPGTSFAAPVVTGVLAQAEQVADLSPEQNLRLLMETARPIAGAQKIEQGAGFLDAEAALRRLGA